MDNCINFSYLDQVKSAAKLGYVPKMSYYQSKHNDRLSRFNKGYVTKDNPYSLLIGNSAALTENSIRSRLTKLNQSGRISDSILNRYKSNIPDSVSGGNALVKFRHGIHGYNSIPINISTKEDSINVQNGSTSLFDKGITKLAAKEFKKNPMATYRDLRKNGLTTTQAKALLGRTGYQIDLNPTYNEYALLRNAGHEIGHAKYDGGTNLNRFNHNTLNIAGQLRELRADRYSKNLPFNADNPLTNSKSLLKMRNTSLSPLSDGIVKVGLLADKLRGI
jgi:hypothetical protein